jgi:hypothetical protein
MGLVEVAALKVLFAKARLGWSYFVCVMYVAVRLVDLLRWECCEKTLLNGGSESAYLCIKI